LLDFGLLASADLHFVYLFMFCLFFDYLLEAKKQLAINIIRPICIMIQMRAFITICNVPTDWLAGRWTDNQ
jgi:hypothetical protein